jgi:Na+-transporting methylmalonyl-CoA/oxaloacetate decarboxylase gamma subunit
MDSSVFDRETLLDLSVNIIPLGIMAFFIVLFALASSFKFDPVIVTIQMGIIIIPLVGLAVLTYYSGRAIAKDEKKIEAGEIETATEADNTE